MKASELVGKLAIRTAPNCHGDSSYTTEPLLIVEVTDSHILYKHPLGSFLHSITGDKVIIMNRCWLDDNWTDYEALMFLAVPPRSGAINLSEVA